jgi:hypothetical protein
MRHHLIALALGAAVLVPLTAAAETSTSVNGYTIHHNAFTTDTLVPEVAKNYGVQRSKYRGMLNVSVIKEKPGTVGEPVPAQVEVQTVELTGQRNRLAMREVKEQDAYYYLGEFSVRDRETMTFVIDVRPEGSGETHTVRMDQQFFTD